MKSAKIEQLTSVMNHKYIREAVELLYQYLVKTSNQISITSVISFKDGSNSANEVEISEEKKLAN